MFKNILKFVAALGIVTSLSTSSFADGADSHAGIYLGLSGSAYGLEMDGKETTANDDNNNTATGTAGKFALIGGGEIGYSMTAGENWLFDFGYSMIPGEAKLETNASDTTDSDATMTVDNYYTLSISPTYAVSDSAALYFKLGYTEADVAVTGDITNPGNLEGTTLAIGSRTQMSSGIYVRTEAGYTEFDSLSTKGKGSTGGVKTTTTYSADPTAAYGRVTIGMKF